MDATSPRWQQVTPSQHAWEEDALAVLRALLPDQDPYRAWTIWKGPIPLQLRTASTAIPVSPSES